MGKNEYALKEEAGAQSYCSDLYCRPPPLLLFPGKSQLTPKPTCILALYYLRKLALERVLAPQKRESSVERRVAVNRERSAQCSVILLQKISPTHSTIAFISLVISSKRQTEFRASSDCLRQEEYEDCC